MKIKIPLLILLIIVMSTTFTVMAEEEQNQADYENYTDNDKDYSIWQQYQVTIDGQLYSFPMDCSEFTSLGWSCNSLENASLDPYHYDLYTFCREEETCSVYLLNTSDYSKLLSECSIAGICIESHDWGDKEGTITLPGGLTRGVSSSEDILAAYGDPDNLQEGDLYTLYTYVEDENQEIELEVYKTTNVLENIRIQNFREPGVDNENEPNNSVPQSVLSYSKPEILSENLYDSQIEIEGEVYAIPVPVESLLSDGWKIVSQSSDSVVQPQYYGWVTLTNEKISLTQTISNTADYATSPENCWLETIEVSVDDNIKASLSGGISLGITESKLKSILKEKEMDYTVTDNGDFRTYSYNSDGFGKVSEAVVYLGVSGGYRRYTVIKISCENIAE